MGIGIDGLPNDYPAGLEHNYAVWSPGSVVSFHNVPWTSDYRDVVQFDTSKGLDDYLANQSGVVRKNTTYARLNAPVSLDIPFGMAQRFNYVRVENGRGGSEVYYYFITHCEYRNPETTLFVLQLDVWATWSRTMTLGSCYIERGHIGVAAFTQPGDYGRDLLTQPEGFDLGSEYGIVGTFAHTVSANNAHDILVYSTTELHGEWGNQDEPKLATAAGVTVNGIPGGMNVYLFASPDELRTFLQNASRYPYITQGIQSIQAVPDGTIPGGSVTTESYSGKNGASGTIKRLSGSYTNKKDVTLGKAFRQPIKDKRPRKYRNLRKFETFPYSAIEVTTNSGTPIVLKPELVPSDDLVMRQFSHVTVPSPRIMFAPKAYNRVGGEFTHVVEDGGENLDIATGITNFPTFSTVNNSYIAFMASNANSIAFQNRSADWSQQKALQGNDLAAQQATAGIELNQDMLRVNNMRSIAQGGVGIGGGLLGGAMSGGGMGGAALGAASGAAGLGINLAANAEANRLQNNNSAYVRDSNKTYADSAAKGDYANSIAAINARVQDAALTQPSTSGQVGGDAFNLSIGGWYLIARVKCVSGASMAAIGDYWLRFGYAINQFKLFTGRNPDLRCMQNFTYWKMSEVNVFSDACPESYRQTLRGILEKGVTVWSDPAKLGRVSLDNNEPKDGVYL